MQKTYYRDLYENQDDFWWYKGMRSITTAFLKKYLPKNDLKILDAGCGAGAALSYLSTFGKTIGVDKSEEALKYARKRGRVKKGDITNLPFKDNTFDLVFCHEVLYHRWVEDDKKAISEFHRVLKKGGLLLLQEPALSWIMGNEDFISYGKHRYTTGELKSKVENNYFVVLKASYINFFLFPLGVLRRLPEISRFKKKRPVSDIFQLPSPINFIFFNILKFESIVLKFWHFPVGMSVILAARKIR